MIAAVKIYLSFVQQMSQQYVKTGRKQRLSEKTLLDAISQADPEKANAIKKQLDDTDQIIKQLRNGKSKAAQARKAEAAEKLERIKEEIKMLKMMGASPRMIARQIAQMAKDLASAAREYASASADYTASSDNVLPEDATNAAPDNNGLSTAVFDGKTPGNAAAPATNTAAVSGGPAIVEKQEAKGQSVPPTTPLTASARTAAKENIQQYQDAVRQQQKTDLQNNASELAAKASATAAHRQFAQEVRRLAALLKILARQQKQRLQLAGDHSADREIAQTNQALAAAENAVSNMQTPLITPAGITVAC